MTRGGTISAAAENKHEGWDPAFLCNRLGSQGSVSPKHLPCHLVNGELELNPECWVWDLAQPLHSGFVPSWDYCRDILTLPQPKLSQYYRPITFLQCHLPSLLWWWLVVSLTSPKHKTHLFCESLVLGSLVFEDAMTDSPKLAASIPIGTIQSWQTSILFFPRDSRPPLLLSKETWLDPTKKPSRARVSCNLCFRKQFMTSLKKRTR